MMKTIEQKMIAATAIHPHAHNREFPTTGEDWLAFVADVAEKGVLVELVVRPDPDGSGYECLQGHRRHAAALSAGIKKLACRVVAASDEEAFGLLWEGNLHRLNPDPVDEARYVRGMMDLFGYELAEVARRMHHSLEWVRTRQRLLDLGDEVITAVRLHGRERLSMGAVEEILKVPEEWWPEAVQLVLYPVFEPHALSESQAKDVLKRCLIEPKARAAGWEAAREKLGKTWRKTLEKLCQKGTKPELAIQVRGLEAAEKLTRGMENAEELVSLAECLPSAPEGLRWLHLAVKHGLAVQVCPVPATGSLMDRGATLESRALVDGSLLRDAEAAAAEHGGEAWLVTRKRRLEKTPADRTAGALAVLDGEGEADYDPEGPAEVELTQTMEHHGFVNLGAVLTLQRWVTGSNADPMNAPEEVPKWARKLAVEGWWTDLEEVLEWFLRLKKP